MITDLKAIKISAPAHRALEAAGIDTILQLCLHSEEELLGLHGVGPKAIGILKELIQKEGLSLKTKD